VIEGRRELEARQKDNEPEETETVEASDLTEAELALPAPAENQVAEAAEQPENSGNPGNENTAMRQEPELVAKEM
jgi:hypothetical protein